MNINQSVMRAVAQITEADKGIPDSAGDRKSPRIRPELRLAVAFLCILLCSLSRNAVFTAAVIAAELLRLAFFPAEVILRVLRRALPPVLLAALILFPSLFMRQTGAPAIVIKVFGTVLILTLLNASLPWSEVTGALGRLLLPPLFLMTLDMTVRFLVILGRYCNALLEATTLRSVGRADWQRSGAGGVLGTVFLKSQQMAAGSSEAMECRCFDGKYRIAAKGRTGWRDALYALLIPLLLLLFFLTQRALPPS